MTSIVEEEENQLALNLATNLILKKRDAPENSQKVDLFPNDRDPEKKKVEEDEGQVWCPFIDDIGKFYIIWKCHGLVNATTNRELIDLLQVQKSALIFLMETRAKKVE